MSLPHWHLSLSVLVLFGCSAWHLEWFTGTKTFFLAAMSHLLGPMPAKQAWCIIWDGKLEGWSIRGRILSLRPFFFDLSGVTQSVVSAIGTSRNLGNDAEWKVEAFVLGRGYFCWRKIHVLRRGNTSLKAWSGGTGISWAFKIRSSDFCS